MSLIGVDRWWMGIGDGRGWVLPEATHLKVKSETPSAIMPRFWRQSPMYPEWETSSFSYLSHQTHGGAKMLKPNGAVIDYTKKPLGTTTRRYFSGPRVGQPCEWIARCAKCGRRGGRSVFIPERKPRQGNAYLSFTHGGHVVDVGIRFFSVDDNCTVTLTDENADDLLNGQEVEEYRAWRAYQNSKSAEVNDV